MTKENHGTARPANSPQYMVECDGKMMCPVHGDVSDTLINLTATTGLLKTAGSFCMHCWVDFFLETPIPRLKKVRDSEEADA